jgi:ATP phosphoribosyltransferase
MLRVAVPNKGALAEEASRMLRDAGYRQRSDSRDLSLTDHANAVQFFYLRPKDIATYVSEGQLHLGITGHDLTEESSASVNEVLELGFGQSQFRYAAPQGNNWSVQDLAGKRIATSFPRLVRANLAQQRIAAKDVIRLDGAVEVSIELEVADAIADVVSTGRTLAQHGLETIGDPILSSQAVVVDRNAKFDQQPDSDSMLRSKYRFVERLRGVVFARQYVMLDYDCPEEVQEAAVEVTPGVQSPTVAPLSLEGWVAVRSMVRRNRVNDVMDELADLGCTGIVTSSLQSCRAVLPGHGGVSSMPGAAPPPAESPSSSDPTTPRLGAVGR